MNNFESFHELDIPESIKRSLQKMNFVTPTPVQAGAIPAGLDGRDVVGTAQTGTGKTAAFAIPMLTSLYDNPGKIGLILAPTRELASQIHSVMDKIGQSSKLYGVLVVGGESFRRQVDEIRRGVDYIVATPGRLTDHLNERTVSLKEVSVLVLDEVDRMLDMGFLPQIREVMSYVPKKRQTMLFSATLPSELKSFVETLVHDPVRITVGDSSKPSAQVKETIRKVTATSKNEALLEEIQTRKGKVLIFARTQTRTQRVARFLELKGIRAICLHGGRTQGQRKQALEAFRRNTDAVMVATDLAGRGLDIFDIDHVINYDIPGTREDYIHRIGRTGRADREGDALSFVEMGNWEEEQIVTGVRPAGATGRSSKTVFSGGPKRSFGGRSRSFLSRSFAKADSGGGGGGERRKSSGSSHGSPRRSRSSRSGQRKRGPR